MTARDITKELGGDWAGSYGLCPGPGHSPRDRSLKVWDGPDQEIYVHSYAADDWREVRDWLRRQGLLPDRRGSEQTDPVENERRRSRVRERQRQREKELKAAAAKRTRAALDIFWSSGAAGSDLGPYLRGRSITIDPLLCLRYARALRHGPTGQNLPAMVAVVQNLAGQFKGIHRTYLDPDRRKKAPSVRSGVIETRLGDGRCSPQTVEDHRGEDRVDDPYPLQARNRARAN